MPMRNCDIRAIQDQIKELNEKQKTYITNSTSDREVITDNSFGMGSFIRLLERHLAQPIVYSIDRNSVNDLLVRGGEILAKQCLDKYDLPHEDLIVELNRTFTVKYSILDFILETGRTEVLKSIEKNRKLDVQDTVNVHFEKVYISQTKFPIGENYPNLIKKLDYYDKLYKMSIGVVDTFEYLLEMDLSHYSFREFLQLVRNNLHLPNHSCVNAMIHYLNIYNLFPVNLDVPLNTVKFSVTQQHVGISEREIQTNLLTRGMQQHLGEIYHKDCQLYVDRCHETGSMVSVVDGIIVNLQFIAQNERRNVMMYMSSDPSINRYYNMNNLLCTPLNYMQDVFWSITQVITGICNAWAERSVTTTEKQVKRKKRKNKRSKKKVWVTETVRELSYNTDNGVFDIERTIITNKEESTSTGSSKCPHARREHYSYVWVKEKNTLPYEEWFDMKENKNGKLLVKVRRKKKSTLINGGGSLNGHIRSN